MNDPSATAESKDPRIDSVLREYLERVDRGESLDREKFVAQHPEIAAELRTFIAAEEQLRKLAGAERAEKRVDDSTQSFAVHGQETIAPQANAQRTAESGGSGLPAEFGRYRIVRALGKGAMGTVYLAEDTQLQRQVALKTPHFEQDPTPELLERFYREARAAATLRHANICPVYDVGQIEGTHYISMAFIDGHPLSAFIHSGKPQPERQILIVVRKLAQALQEAHDHGIVHRDLKPANIMVDKRNEPVIMDFGLARQLRGEKNIRITQSGMLIGTPAYMSPEQIDGEPDKVGPPSDQYSLGVILYELLSGQLPFRGSLTAVMAQIITKEAPPLSQLRPGLDPRIEAACIKMMAKAPADRFASLSAVAEELATILRNPGAKPKSEDPGGPVATAAPIAPATQQKPAASGSLTPSSGILQSLTKKSLTGVGQTASLHAKDLASLEELARKCLARHDYDQVIQIIERIPEEKRSAGLTAVLEKSREKTDEIAFLICEIDEAVRLNDRATALKKADELLKIKPAHHRALQVQQEFAGYGAGGAARIGPLQQFTRPWNEGGWIPWSVLAFGLAVCGVMTGVIVIVLDKKTTVVIDVKDPDVTVSVKGTNITVTGPKQEKVEVEPGEQHLTIRYKGLDFITEKSFEIKKKQQRIVRVSIVDGAVVAKLDDEISALTFSPDREEPGKAKGAAEASPKAQDKSNAVAKAALGQAHEKKKELAEEGRPALLAAPFDATAAKNARQQWADHLKRPGEVTNAIGMKLALIPPGEFHMGSADPRMPNDARPLHRVRITRPFYLGVYEVTQAEFQRIMGVNPSRFHDDPRLPVESISWDDVQKFFGKLNAMPAERQAGRAYRLPTEAEWEYACRAGAETLFSFGDAITTNQANFNGEQQSPFGIPQGTWLKRTTRVGSYPANAFGIHDMDGNVLEGIADWYSRDYYASSPVDDPQGPATGEAGGGRGGSWHSPATPSAFRVAGPRNTRSDEVGFRVACDILPVDAGAAANALASAAGVSAQEGFVPLFNGKDLSGWKVGKFNPGNWRVEQGVLVGSKSPFGFIHTVRDDFTDFHLRVEARLNDGGNGGVIVRGNNGFYGYEADLNNPRDTGSNRTGTLWTQRETLVGFLEPLVPPGEWFTLDVIAEGDHIVVQVNGRTTADYTDEKRRSRRGYINLQQAHEETVVEFRKIEIKELGRSTGSAGVDDPRQAAILNGQWHVEGDELVQSDAPGHKDLANHNAPLLIFGDENWSSYDLTLKAKETRGNDGLAVVFHWLEDYDWCDFGLGVYQNRGTELVHMIKGKWGRQKGNYKSFKVEPDHWYSIKIEVRGNACRCFVDGKMKFQQTDARFTHGRIGVATWGSAARFRQIKVTDPGGKVLWKGPPKLGTPGGERESRPTTGANEQGSSQAEFVPLFNGKDLSGWKTDPSQPGDWRVENGLLVGDRPSSSSFLYSERGDYQDFHLRIEARLKSNEFSGVWVRAQVPSPDSKDKTPRPGYRVDLREPADRRTTRTGSIFAVTGGPHVNYAGFGNLKPLVQPGQWFTIDVVAEGNHILVIVNGTTTSDNNWRVQDDYRSGHIALGRLFEEPAVGLRNVEFRKIEIKELAASKTAAIVAGQADAGVLTAPFDESTAKKAQQEWSDRLKTPVELTNSIGMPLRLIPPGQFRMGGVDFGNERKSAHDVRITRPFYFGRYEVTRGEFARFATAKSFLTDADRNPGGWRPDNSKDRTKWEPHQQFTWRHPGFPQEDNHPVVDISWDDACAFCKWLSDTEGKTYRLPTEAEWEYACRAGTTGRTYGADGEELTKIGNVADASANATFPEWRTVKSSDGWVYTSPVGLFRPNNFGLYDTIGNAHEWCSDWYGNDYYRTSPQTDPPGPSSGELRVSRGTSFNGIGDALSRSKHTPAHHLPDWGFRVVCEIPLNPSGPKAGAASHSPVRSPKISLRRLWQGSYSKFENWRSRSWRETIAKDGKVYNFREVARTPQYVEMIDKGRGKGGVRVRLTEDQMLMIWGGRNVDWEKQQSGHWESAAKDRDPKIAAVSAPADLAASSPKNDTRSLWKGAKSSFENTDPGKWHETFYKEEPGHDFNEVARTAEFVEIVDPTRGLRIRLTDDQARFIHDGKGKDWGTFQTGSWRP
jgi:formylglycine-generating enzyme required for sulfatase activity/serine/threonine protein kinase